MDKIEHRAVHDFFLLKKGLAPMKIHIEIVNVLGYAEVRWVIFFFKHS